MSYLCAGRNTDREAREFVEKVLAIAREYFLPPYQFQVRVGGLYLMYAIYQIQPVSPKAKIRLTFQQWDEALNFEQQAKQQSHLDVVYIFNKLIQEQAFQFCFTSQEMGLQPKANESEDAEVDLADEMKEEKCLINKLFNYESLEQLSYLQDQYQKMKVALAGPNATKPDKSLDVVKKELVEDIVLSLQNFKENVANMSKRVGQSSQVEDETDLKTKAENVGSRRQALKNQAYSISPSTKQPRQCHSPSLPEKDLALDRANRAAQRALAKSRHNGLKDSDNGLNEKNARNVSPMRLGSEEISEERKRSSKKSSIPVNSSDDEDLFTDDGSDDEYVPPSTRKKMEKKSCQPKIASRQRHQIKKSRKMTILNDASESNEEKSPKEAITIKNHNALTQLIDSSDSEQSKAGSGFRIARTPIKKYNENSGTIASIKRSRGRPPKYSHTVLSNDSSMQQKQQDCNERVTSSGKNDKSKKCLPTKRLFFDIHSEAEQISVSQKQSCERKANNNVSDDSSDESPPRKKNQTKNMRTASYEFYMAPVSRNAFKGIGNNNPPKAMSHVESKESPKTKSKTAQVVSSENPKTCSTHEVLTVPTAKEFKSNIFFNAVSKNSQTKDTDKSRAIAQPCHHETDKGKRDNSEHVESSKIPVKFKDVLRTNEQLGLQTEKNHSADSKGECRQHDSEVNTKNHPSQGIKKYGFTQVDSSYKIIIAPAASQNYADMGDNATALPLQLKFPKAQLSHTLKGNFQLKDLNLKDQSQITVDTAVQRAPTSKSVVGQNLEKTSTEKLLLSKDATCIPGNKIQSYSQPKSSVGKEIASKAARKNEKSSHGYSDAAYLPPRKRRCPRRKSKYCTNFVEIPDETAQEPSKEPLVQPENLAKAFKNMSTVKKEMPIKSESKPLKAMRLLREKLARESKIKKEEFPMTESPEVLKASKVVLDSVRFI
ncbi:snRNA-activating protein complex subunit 1 [Plakobranchus ocellatus]|uniref:snRNA-activating protein complex subunit 1 n=1 Tax=Plakobranchus ocellatus TaxID=259542 RepID=A0AAV3Y036_9GAST|nr:snRNA-activating protein complex subunit 1 [Plakobranchus ocellatus]